MPLDPIFYYQQKNTTASYNYDAEGIPVVERLIKKQAWWKKSDFGFDNNPRALILADWTAFNWSEEKNQLIILKLTDLLQQGFPLYLWQDGRVVALTLDLIRDLDEAFYREKITLAYPDEIIKAAISQHSLTSEQILILDDYWINYLANDNQRPAGRSLDAGDIHALSSSYLIIEKIIAIAQQSKPALCAITHNNFSNYINQLIQWPQFRNLVVKSDYRDLTLNNADLGVLLRDGKVNLDGSIYKRYQLSGLEKFKTHDSSLDLSNLQKLLSLIDRSLQDSRYPFESRINPPFSGASGSRQ